MPTASPRHAGNPVLVELGKAIRRSREERGLSQEALAHETGIDRAYVGSIERGDQNTGVMNLHTIAAALGMSIAELATEAGI